MIFGVLQKLNIIQQTQTKLVLREQPLLEWFGAGGLLLLATNLAFLNFWLTASAAVVLALFVAAQARTRIIRFDAVHNQLTINLNSLFSKQQVMSEVLNEIARAYLHQDDGGSTQIILVRADGKELGLSVYSRDAQPWKETITIAINAVLHEAHRDDNDGASR